MSISSNISSGRKSGGDGASAFSGGDNNVGATGGRMMGDLNLTAGVDLKGTGNSSIASGSGLISTTGGSASGANASSLGAEGSDNTSIGSMSIQG